MSSNHYMGGSYLFARFSDNGQGAAFLDIDGLGVFKYIAIPAGNVPGQFLQEFQTVKLGLIIKAHGCFDRKERGISC